MKIQTWFKSTFTFIWLSVFALPVLSENLGSLDGRETSLIDIAGYEVPVLKNGLYDRFRSNPPLNLIQRIDPSLDLSWFETLEKKRLDMGFESYSPNFYYRNSRITAVFTANIDVLKSLMPEKVLQQVQPLQIWPGRGVVAITAYSYYYCDNDAYNEVAISVVTNKPNTTSFGPLTLALQSFNSDYWGYVLKLPVNTELAKVRGVVGYNLPKWLTRIDSFDHEQHVQYDIYDEKSGLIDISFRASKLTDLTTEVHMTRNSFVNLDHASNLISGYADARQLQYAETRDDAAVDLVLSEQGALSQFIKGLELGSLLKYEYVPHFQLALYAPATLTVSE